MYGGFDRIHYEEHKGAPIGRVRRPVLRQHADHIPGQCPRPPPAALHDAARASTKHGDQDFK